MYRPLVLFSEFYSILQFIGTILNRKFNETTLIFGHISLKKSLRSFLDGNRLMIGVICKKKKQL